MLGSIPVFKWVLTSVQRPAKDTCRIAIKDCFLFGSLIFLVIVVVVTFLIPWWWCCRSFNKLLIFYFISWHSISTVQYNLFQMVYKTEAMLCNILVIDHLQKTNIFMMLFNYKMENSKLKWNYLKKKQGCIVVLKN